MEGWRRSAFVCEICAAPMRFGEIEAHKRVAHADVLPQIQAANRYMVVLLAIILLPSLVAMFAALLVPSVVFHVHASGAYILAVFVAWIAGICLPLRYAYRRTQRRFASLGGVLRWCHVCGSKVPYRAWRPHLEGQHPSEARYLRASLFAALGSLLAWACVIIIVVSLGLLDILRFSPLDIDKLYFAAWTGMLTWMICVAVYSTVFWPRHVERSRSVWRDLGGRR